mmetsp:Transcript_12536/g.35747  ORF Transcript_12536/g.35747 Transcript_12536/m.35747 type:complete len:228 (-) Transcript_12536:457-1140(-)
MQLQGKLLQPRTRQNFRYCRPVLRIRTQDGVQELACLRRGRARQRGHNAQARVPARQPAPGQHRVDGAAERVDVALGVVGLAHQDLWCHIASRAKLHIEALGVEVLVGGHQAGVREVDQLEIAVGRLGREEDVGGLHVPVDYALAVQEGQALADGAGGFSRGLLVQALLALNAVRQGLGTQPLHDKVVNGILCRLLGHQEAEFGSLFARPLEAAEDVHDVRVRVPCL